MKLWKEAQMMMPYFDGYNNGSYNNGGYNCGQGHAINFLNGISIGTEIYVWFDSSGFICARYEGVQSGVALFTVGGRTMRIPFNQIIAVAT